LRQSGLVEEDRDEFDSRVRIYRLRSEPMTALKAWLEATETLWTRQLLALKSHLNKTKR
jgi:DNA-binding transcriptional ArsR family regulator